MSLPRSFQLVAESSCYSHKFCPGPECQLNSDQRTSAGSASANGALLIASSIGTATAGDVQTIGNLPSEGADERVQNTDTAIEAADLFGHDLDLGPVPTSVVINLPSSPPHSSSYTAVVDSHSASVLATVHAGGINGASIAEPAVENRSAGRVARGVPFRPTPHFGYGPQ